MTLAGRRKVLIAAGAALTAAVGFGALAAGWLIVAAAALAVLLLLTVALQLMVLGRIELRQKNLDRLEQKIDAVARRVVTESEATGRELGARLDALADDLRR